MEGSPLEVFAPAGEHDHSDTGRNRDHGECQVSDVSQREPERVQHLCRGKPSRRDRLLSPHVDRLASVTGVSVGSVLQFLASRVTSRFRSLSTVSKTFAAKRGHGVPNRTQTRSQIEVQATRRAERHKLIVLDRRRPSTEAAGPRSS